MRRPDLLANMSTQDVEAVNLVDEVYYDNAVSNKYRRSDTYSKFIIIGPDSVGVYSLFVSFVTLFVIGPDSVGVYSLFVIVPDSVGGYSLFVSFVCLFVCLSVSPFPQPCFNTETVTLVSYPGMANHRSLLNLDLIRPW